MKPTSILDVPSYRNFCLKSAQDEATFKKFRRAREITISIDTVDGAYGKLYLDRIKEHYPHLLEHMAEFARNDKVGSPYVATFKEIGDFCPTTLRYVKTLGHLVSLFGPMDGWRVVEIGGGYGGLARILSYAFDFANYAIVDLPETLELAKRYHREFGVPNMEYIPPDSLQKMTPFDLVISNYAFSECEKEVQDDYLQKVICHAKRGYLIINFLGEAFPVTSYSSEELQMKLSDFGFEGHVEREDPVPDEHNVNQLFVWQ